MDTSVMSMPSMIMSDGTTSTLSASTTPHVTNATATFNATAATDVPITGVDMGVMMSQGGCKISMLWNWYTIDACFLSTDWRIRSQAGFAALCIGVILLVVLLEALRFAAKFYDRQLIKTHQLKTIAAATGAAIQTPGDGENSNNNNDADALMAKSGHHVHPVAPFRPSIWHQLMRALLHALQFAVAYWIMLLAMYYNGFIIICIILGSFLGAFIFQWERIGGRYGAPGAGQAEEVTGCCG